MNEFISLYLNDAFWFVMFNVVGAFILWFLVATLIQEVKK